MNNEEYRQQQAEEGNFDKSIDASAYKKVFQALRSQPIDSLPPGFADKVVEMIHQREASKISAVELTLALVGGFFLVIIFILAILLTGFRIQLGFLESLQSFKGVIMFGIVFLLLINWFDKLVARKKAIV